MGVLKDYLDKAEAAWLAEPSNVDKAMMVAGYLIAAYLAKEITRGEALALNERLLKVARAETGASAIADVLARSMPDLPREVVDKVADALSVHGVDADDIERFEIVRVDADGNAEPFPTDPIGRTVGNA